MEREWERLFRSAYDRLNYLLHVDFIEDSLSENIKLLDAGCGGGRFSIEFGKRACRLTLLDISDEQIRIAKEKVKAYGQLDQVDQALVGDIGNLEALQDNSFDVVVCYGAPISYLYKNYEEGIKELYRVVKPGGKVFISVNSRYGVIRSLIGRQNYDIVDFLSRKDYWFVDQVVDHGDLPEHPDVAHPPRHFFNAEELEGIFDRVGFKGIEMASSPCLSVGMADRIEDIAKDKKAWETLVDLEIKAYRNPATLDLGEFLMISGTK